MKRGLLALAAVFAASIAPLIFLGRASAFQDAPQCQDPTPVCSVGLRVYSGGATALLCVESAPFCPIPMLCAPYFDAGSDGRFYHACGCGGTPETVKCQTWVIEDETSLTLACKPHQFSQQICSNQDWKCCAKKSSGSGYADYICCCRVRDAQGQCPPP